MHLVVDHQRWWLLAQSAISIHMKHNQRVKPPFRSSLKRTLKQRTRLVGPETCLVNKKTIGAGRTSIIDCTTKWVKVTKIKKTGRKKNRNYSRVSCFPLLVLKIDEAIAKSTLGEDILGIGRIDFNFLAEIGDVQAKQVVVVDVFVSPNLG